MKYAKVPMCLVAFFTIFSALGVLSLIFWPPTIMHFQDKCPSGYSCEKIQEEQYAIVTFKTEGNKSGLIAWSKQSLNGKNCWNDRKIEDFEILSVLYENGTEIPKCGTLGGVDNPSGIVSVPRCEK